jgi:hypothetical protein
VQAKHTFFREKEEEYRFYHQAIWKNWKISKNLLTTS